MTTVTSRVILTWKFKGQGHSLRFTMRRHEIRCNWRKDDYTILKLNGIIAPAICHILRTYKVKGQGYAVNVYRCLSVGLSGVWAHCYEQKNLQSLNSVHRFQISPETRDAISRSAE